MATPTIITCPNCGTKNRVRAQADGVPRCAKCHNPLPWQVEADRDSFDAEIHASMPVVVDFWAPWCGPCKMIEPVLNGLTRTRAGKLKVVRLNVDDAPDLAGRYQVQGIPLLVLMRDGEEVDRLVGAAPQARIEAWLAPHIDAQAAAT